MRRGAVFQSFTLNMRDARGHHGARIRVGRAATSHDRRTRPDPMDPAHRLRHGWLRAHRTLQLGRSTLRPHPQCRPGHQRHPRRRIPDGPTLLGCHHRSDHGSHLRQHPRTVGAPAPLHLHRWPRGVRVVRDDVVRAARLGSDGPVLVLPLHVTGVLHRGDRVRDPARRAGDGDDRRLPRTHTPLQRQELHRQCRRHRHPLVLCHGELGHLYG